MPVRTLDSNVDRLVAAYSSLLMTKNAKYSLNCFGQLFACIPSRLGADDVLDLSADAFLEGLVGIWAPSPKQRVKAMTKHGVALRCLRNALYNPALAKSPYTLYATILFMISRNWFSKDCAAHVSHMEGIAYLLNTSARDEWTCQDDNLRVCIIYPAAIEAIVNPKIKVSQWYKFRDTPAFGPHQPLHEHHGQPVQSLTLSAILDFPRLLDEPERNQGTILAEYMRLRYEYPVILKRLNALRNAMDSMGPRRNLVAAQVQLETACIYMLSYTLILNAFLAALDPLNTTLHHESIELASEAIRLSKESGSHLPARMGFVPWALLAAWATASDENVTRTVVRMIQQRDVYDVYYADLAYIRMFRSLQQRILMLRLSTIKSLCCAEESSTTRKEKISLNWGRNGPS
ncbi:hypothetical protein VHEMI10756 [[Torrubiella] hemipterigena]|nr:hypothetical protein VHEMI10756 [[Torrubiella] hemipterigena]